MFYKILIAAVICAVVSSSARADEPAGGVDFFQATLAEILDTPLLAASYSEEKPSDAAASASVITAETISKRGYATLADLLADTPQFQLQRNSDVRRLNLISVRGIPNNERLVILYDGIRVTPPTGDLLAMAGQFSLKNAARVEVVLGPMSSLYGADAFSGVINIVSRKGGKAAAGFKYGRFNSVSGDLSAATGLSNGGPASPSAGVTFEARAGDNPRLPDFYKRDYAWYNNEYRRGLAQVSPYNASTTTVPALRYDAGEDSSFLNARLSLGNFETGLIRMRESHSSSIGVKPELTLYSKDARFSTAYWTLYGRHTYTSPDETWTLTSLISHYNYEIEPESKFRNSFSGYQDAYKYALSQTSSLQETLSFETAAGCPAILGLTYQENSVLPYTADLGHKFNKDKSPSSQGFVYSGSTIPVDFYSLNYSNIGAFMRVQTPEMGNATLSLALRYDNNSSYGTTWNPRAGLVWKPGGSEQTVVKLLYGEAYLAPSPFSTHKHFGSFISSPTAASGYHSYFFHVPNEGLEPEKVRSVEGSLSHRFGQELRLSLNPYYNKVRELIQDIITGPGTFKGVEVDNIEMAQNRGTLETYGATLRADAVLRSGRWGFEPWAAYTYSEGKLTGDPIPFNSRHSLQAGISVLRGKWAVTPKVLYRSYSRDQDGQRVPQFAVADLFVRCAIPGLKAGGLTAYLELKNIFDRRYYNAAYGGGADHLEGAPQNPFEASGGLSYKF
ncbi:MAG: TonB-dependent receptor plug domain-containing protein [Elusimicrobiales bacterium]|nr:TonB-dependent receptor plug domain-containing protein [Elusimicrobiales bacterium]